MSLTKEIAEAVEELRAEEAEALVKKALEDKVPPLDILRDGIVVGMRMVGDRFAACEYFLAELMMGADIGKKCIDLITPQLPKIPEAEKSGKVVLGTVKSDIHSIGKDLVATQLSISGFEVYNIGINVPSMKFIEKAQEVNADVIALSGFLTTTVPYMAEIVNYLVDLGLRDRYKVIIGGGITTKEYADSIGADGWALNAFEAVKLCNQLLADLRETRPA